MILTSVEIEERELLEDESDELDERLEPATKDEIVEDEIDIVDVEPTERLELKELEDELLSIGATLVTGFEFPPPAEPPPDPPPHPTLIKMVLMYNNMAKYDLIF